MDIWIVCKRPGGRTGTGQIESHKQMIAPRANVSCFLSYQKIIIFDIKEIDYPLAKIITF